MRERVQWRLKEKRRDVNAQGRGLKHVRMKTLDAARHNRMHSEDEIYGAMGGNAEGRHTVGRGHQAAMMAASYSAPNGSDAQGMHTHNCELQIIPKCRAGGIKQSTLALMRPNLVQASHWPCKHASPVPVACKEVAQLFLFQQLAACCKG